MTDGGDCCGGGGGGPPTRGVIPVNFIGVNHPPSFPECSSYLNAFSIAENQPPNTPVGNVSIVLYRMFVELKVLVQVYTPNDWMYTLLFIVF